jgi:hypothetical protein
MSAHEATTSACIASAIASTHGLAVHETIEHAVRAVTSHALLTYKRLAAATPDISSDRLTFFGWSVKDAREPG